MIIREPDICLALKALCPEANFGVVGNTYEGIDWQSPEIPVPSQADVEAEIARQMAALPLEVTKEMAKGKIAATDWSVLPDVGLANASDFVAYRATLRDLIKNPVENPSWPTEPTPVWS